jgi:hypothetical protein
VRVSGLQVKTTTDDLTVSSDNAAYRRIRRAAVAAQGSKLQSSLKKQNI